MNNEKWALMRGVYDLRFTIYDLRFTIYDLRFGGKNHEDTKASQKTE